MKNITFINEKNIYPPLSIKTQVMAKRKANSQIGNLTPDR